MKKLTKVLMGVMVLTALMSAVGCGSAESAGEGTAAEATTQA